MNVLLLKAAPWALVVALAGGLVAGYSTHEREIGRLQIQFQAADSLHRAAVAEANNWQRKAVIDSSRAAALEADTAKANANARHLATAYRQTLPILASTRRSLDSAIQVAQQHPDSGSQGILDALRPYLAHSDSTIKACSDAVQADSAALAACQAHGRALTAQLTDLRGMNAALQKDTLAKARQIKIAGQGQPSAFSTWLWRLGAFGLGLVAARVGK